MRPSIPTLAVVLLAITGCVGHDGPAFFVVGAVAPDEMCVLSSDGALLARGVFDLSSGTGYDLYPLYQNQLVPRAATSPPRANPNDIRVMGAEVTLSDAAGTPINFGGLPNPFSVSGYTLVPTGEQQAGAFEVVPPSYATVLDSLLGADPIARQTLLIVFRPWGSTTGEVGIESDDFVWPVDLCHAGCLFEPADMDSEACCDPGQDKICPLLL